MFILLYIQINKFMYPGVSYGKKVLQKKQEERKLQGHLDRIRNVRPNATGWTFYDQPRALNNGKKNMMMEDKCTEIQRENRLLLEKIQNTMNKRAQSVSERERANRSLHGSFRKKQLENIEIENARLLRRLQEKKSSYGADKLNSEWKKQKAVIKNIANYPFVIKDGPPKPKRRSQSKPLNLDFDRSGLNGDIEMVRIRNLGGVTIVITVKIDPQQMTVLGDIKGSKAVKIIEIPRQQAIQFIEVECQGKLQNIFDRLQYEPNEGVLYLLSKDTELDELPPDVSHPKQR